MRGASGAQVLAKLIDMAKLETPNNIYNIIQYILPSSK